MIGVHVKTPAILKPMFEHFFDPVPYAGEGLAIPNIDVPPRQPIYWNGDYSRLDEWLPWLFQKHREGHYVVLLVPLGDNSETRAVFSYGAKRFTPETRLFPEVRDVELVILTGENQGKATSVRVRTI